MERLDAVVMGGGNLGKTLAADMALAGLRVGLYEVREMAPRTLGGVLKDGKLSMSGCQANPKGFRRSGIAQLELVTTDPKEAVEATKILLIAVPATHQERFFSEIIPHLRDGTVVSIHPDNFGSLVLRRMMREMGCDAEVVVGGWHSAPYGTRTGEDGELLCDVRESRQVFDALPSSDADAFEMAVGKLPIFDGASSLERADTVVGVGLENPNPAVHVPGSILNVGAMEVSETEGLFGIPRGRWSMYAHGMSPSVARVQLAFYMEELSIMRALGIRPTVVHPQEQFSSRLSIMAPEYRIPFGICLLHPENWRISGPTSVEHRYFTEDIPIGCVARLELARALGVKTPVIESLVRIGSALCSKDFESEGRTLRKMGLAGMGREEMLSYLRGGLRP